MERRFSYSSGKRFLGLAFLCALWLSTPIGTSFAEEFPKPGKNDRCPVCGMSVSKYPKWVGGIVFQSGKHYFHCSPKCMLHNLLHVPKYQPGETREKVRDAWVTEYYTTKQMNAAEVLFVVGTNLVGPMGLDLIPVQGKDAAENLKKDYNGELIVPLQEITPEMLDKVRKGRLK